MKRKYKKTIRMIIGLILLILFSYSQNNWLQLTALEVYLKSLPSAFDGYKILQLSDLHGKSFGKEQQRLVALIKEQQPDLIVITGDSVDSRRLQETPSLELFAKITSIAPVYFVTGNHEGALPDLDAYLQKVQNTGVVVLQDELVQLERQGDTLFLLGMDDKNVSGDQYLEHKLEEFDETLGGEPYILLAHRPDLIDLYAALDVPLVFSGHAHGGQVRLPFVGGIVSPGQGFFPDFTEGLNQVNNTRMVVSRGLGNSLFPQRVFNRPEIVVVTLKSE